MEMEEVIGDDLPWLCWRPSVSQGLSLVRPLVLLAELAVGDHSSASTRSPKQCRGAGRFLHGSLQKKKALL